VFQASCTAQPAAKVELTLREGGEGAPGKPSGKVIGTADIHGRIVTNAWNILRVLVEENRVRVWLNPVRVFC
jgi:hypothetical protein